MLVGHVRDAHHANDRSRRRRRPPWQSWPRNCILKKPAKTRQDVYLYKAFEIPLVAGLAVAFSTSCGPVQTPRRAAERRPLRDPLRRRIHKQQCLRLSKLDERGRDLRLGGGRRGGDVLRRRQPGHGTRVRRRGLRLPGEPPRAHGPAPAPSTGARRRRPLPLLEEAVAVGDLGGTREDGPRPAPKPLTDEPRPPTPARPRPGCASDANQVFSARASRPQRHERALPGRVRQQLWRATRDGVPLRDVALH